MDRIMERVSEIFKIVFNKADLEISEETCADDIEEWGSLKHLNLLAMIEEDFDIQFEVSDVVSMQNVGDMIRCIESLLEE